MAWENVIIGYKRMSFDEHDIVPVGARFLCSDKEFVRMVGWVSNPQTYYKTIFWYDVPVYKKKNIKR